MELGHGWISTEHLLLALIREGEGIAAQVLLGYGANLNRVRQVVTALIPPGFGGGQPGQTDNFRLIEEIARLRRILQRHGIDPDTTTDNDDG